MIKFLVYLSGLRSLERLRERGSCKGHYQQMRPPKFRVNVVDSPDIDKWHSIDKQYEILVRLTLSLFANDPNCYSAVNNQVFKIASELVGGLALKDESGNKLDLLHECLISSKLCEAMKADDKVKVNYIYLHNYF